MKHVRYIFWVLTGLIVLCTFPFWFLPVGVYAIGRTIVGQEPHP